jgi:hypothetical protein
MLVGWRIQMKMSELFSEIHYVGKAEGDRKTYYIFARSSGYLVVTPSSNTSFNMNMLMVKHRTLYQRHSRGNN